MASPAAPARLPEGGLLTVTPTARRYCQAPPRSVSSSATWGRPIDSDAYCSTILSSPASKRIVFGYLGEAY